MSNDKVAMTDSNFSDEEVLGLFNITDAAIEEHMRSYGFDTKDLQSMNAKIQEVADMIYVMQQMPCEVDEYLPNAMGMLNKSTLTDHNSIASMMSPTEIEKLQDEKNNLLEERTSLDRQSKLYEAEKDTLLKEKNFFQNKCESLYCEIDKLKHELQEAKIIIKQLQAANKFKENELKTQVHQIQTEVREKEFEDMRTKTLQDQLQTLAFENLQLRSENDSLEGQESQASNSGESADRQFVNVLMEE